MQYRREIDGLRAIAVLPVIFFHAGFPFFTGGYVGVDVFFVISGYLITTILLQEMDSDKFTFSNFYERRARRILPALFFVIICTFPFAWYWMLPYQFENYSKSLIAIVFFSSNILFFKQADYFAPAAENNPMLHTWSLGVEEQFYIFFPLLMVWLWPKGKSYFVRVVIAIVVFSFFLTEFGWRNHPEANFFLLLTRAWELGVGVICALYLYYREKRESLLLSLIGFLAILYSVLFFHENTPTPSYYTLIPVVGTAFLILFCDQESLVGKILSWRPLVAIGLISFSAYLWHQPIFAFSRIGPFESLSLLQMFFLVVLSLLLAFITWKYVEIPFRKKGKIFQVSRSRFVYLSVGVAVLFIIVGGWGVMTEGLKQQWVARNPHQTQIYEIIDSAKSNRANLNECHLRTLSFDQGFLDKMKACYEEYGAADFIIGDSHGIDLFNGYAINNPDEFIIGSVKGGCRIDNPEPHCQYEHAKEFVKENVDYINNIIFHQSGFRLLEKYDGYRTQLGRDMFEEFDLVEPMNPDWFHVQDGAVESIVNYLEDLAQYRSVYWLGPRVEPQISDSYILEHGCDYEYQLRPGQRKIYSNLSDYISGKLYSSSVVYVNLQKFVDLNMKNDFISCQGWLWTDTDHWSTYGEKEFVRRLLDQTTIFK
ncbi:acyltransferase family protein [Marinospirillum sp.]|uniref:acyltransferase family protein n=1 Tax=Marinospirillum sp. TaxID=2183934 RepID=UPI00384E255A